MSNGDIIRSQFDEGLYHYGIPGMKWGVHKAKRENKKVDKSFKDWKENDAKKKNAIELGKKNNANRRAYEDNKSDKSAKALYKQSNKAYKKALNSNTSWRKGSIRQEVGQDAARKYLSDAKNVKKQLDKNPSDKQLQKKYKYLMDRHDVERAKARKAASVGQNRSYKKAAMKRKMTMTVSAVAATAAVSAGAYAVNRYLNSHGVTLNGTPVSVNSDTIRKYADVGKKIIGLGKYMY